MDETDHDRFPVVGVGASDGGIAALQQLFGAIPAAPGLAMVVQHVVPGDPSRLVELIRRWSALPVAAAVDGTVIEVDHVYVAEPGSVVTVDGVLRVAPTAAASLRASEIIDALLASIAADRGDRSVAIILSGTGHGGAAGAVVVKRAGGLVLVQDPVTCDHDEMPTSAIATGTVDAVVPAADLGRALVDRAAGRWSPPTDARASFDRILGHIRRHAGLELASYRPTPLLWRITRRMGLRRVPSLDDYERLLADDAAELDAVIAGLPIHVTEFFRDPEAWDELVTDALEPLIAEAAGRELRLWTAGCATGEEAYSLAMLLLEHATADRALPFRLFATDASAAVVARASRGQFAPAAVARLSPERRARFFYPVDGGYRVTRAVRERMVFAPHDLLVDPPVTGLDLVTCRNLLMYLEPEAIDRVLHLLHGALRPGGYLLLGRGESVAPGGAGFATVSAPSRLYRKTGSMVDPTSRGRPVRNDRALPAPSQRAAVGDLPSVLVDADLGVLRVHGDTSSVLRLPEGEPTRNLLALADPALVPDLLAAAAEALRLRRAVMVRAPRSGPGSVLVHVSPLLAAEPVATRLLISFEPDPARDGDPTASTEALRVSSEELGASRAELRVVNAELKAANEELDSGNLDLGRVNAELQQSNAELEMQSQVLRSGAVITLFLDGDLRIRWFTPGVRELFPLIPADVGRRITDLTPQFDDPPFVSRVAAVIATSSPDEAEVRARSGRWFLRRIRPYLRGDTATGVAITFTDVTDRKAVHDALVDAEARSRHLVEGIAQAFWEADAGGAVVADSPSWRAATGQSVEQRLGRGWLDAIHHDDRAGAELAWREAIAARDLVDVEARLRTADGGYRWTNVRATPISAGDGSVDKWVAMNIDIDARKRAELLLRDSESRLTADLAGMVRLHALHARLATEDDLDAALRAILIAACDVTGAERGWVQLVAADGSLAVVARYGDDDRARAEIEPAAHSIPLECRAGARLGALTTQYREPDRPSPDDRRLLEFLAWTAANVIERQRAERALRTSEERLRRLLAAGHGGDAEPAVDATSRRPDS